ncbi:NADPH-dependent oxidoreductase, partial [Streptomyces sp. SID11233]|nr:NADPH-dependent oxidoreductase [Streptomyces sp. SID11233]
MTRTPDRTPARPPVLTVLVASVREGRFGPAVGAWFAEQARTHGGFDV